MLDLCMSCKPAEDIETMLKTSSSLCIVGQFDGFIFSAKFINAQDWTKDFLPPNFH